MGCRLWRVWFCGLGVLRSRRRDLLGGVDGLRLQEYVVGCCAQPETWLLLWLLGVRVRLLEFRGLV